MLLSAVPLPPVSPRPGTDLDQLLEEARALAERVDRRLREGPPPSAPASTTADAAELVEN